jgi:DNA-binding NarL/FixJ family response regulator
VAGKSGTRPWSPCSLLVLETGGKHALLIRMEGLPEVQEAKANAGTGDTEHRLTPAEAAVARAAVAGLSNREIARQRGSSPRTVAEQLRSVYGKLGISSRTELAVLMARDRSG